MRRLPPLGEPACHVRLPLSASSESLLAAALLSLDAEQPQECCRAALAEDPSLALWAACRAAEQEGKKRETIASLADWLMQAGPEECVASDAVEKSDDSAKSYGKLVARSVQVAILAAKLAEAAGHGEQGNFVAEQAYLAGLLHNPAGWRISLESPIVDTAAASFVESALELLQRRESWPETLGLARRELKRLGAAARRRWLAVVPGTEGLLPAAVARIRQLRFLQQGGRAKLEQEKLASLAEFAAGAGHEINNPLAVISGRAQLLLRQEQHPGRQHDLAVIHTQAMRVHEMISDLMLFARPPQPDLARVDVSRVIDDVLRELEPVARGQDVELRRGDLRQSLVLRADGAQLAVVIRALCENALNELEPGGRIEVVARNAASADPVVNGGPSSICPSVEIRISDDGPGISKEVRPHLFDPFYSGRQAGRGLGVGLSKCWRIVTNHGGRMEAHDNPARGATFVVTLPVEGPPE